VAPPPAGGPGRRPGRGWAPRGSGAWPGWRAAGSPPACARAPPPPSVNRPWRTCRAARTRAARRGLRVCRGTTSRARADRRSREHRLVLRVTGQGWAGGRDAPGHPIGPAPGPPAPRRRGPLAAHGFPRAGGTGSMFRENPGDDGRQPAAEILHPRGCVRTGQPQPGVLDPRSVGRRSPSPGSRYATARKVTAVLPRRPRPASHSRSSVTFPRCQCHHTDTWRPAKRDTRGWKAHCWWCLRPDDAGRHNITVFLWLAAFTGAAGRDAYAVGRATVRGPA